MLFKSKNKRCGKNERSERSERGEKNEKMSEPTMPPKKPENPRIILEFLPDNTVKPIVFWEPHTNVNAVLMAGVLNLLNQGKLYEHFKQAVEKQGEVSGDAELAYVILKNIKNPKSIEDEKPIIPASMVTRLHFSQQRINSTED